VDGFRGHTGRRTYRADRFALDLGQASGHVEFIIAEPCKTSEYPPFCRPDNRTGIDDNCLCLARIFHNRAIVMPQHFQQFGSITEIVPAAIGLDVNGTAAERTRKILHFSESFVPFTSFGRFHVRSGGSLIVIHYNAGFHR
jgi:hypothetical protein